MAAVLPDPGWPRGNCPILLLATTVHRSFHHHRLLPGIRPCSRVRVAIGRKTGVSHGDNYGNRTDSVIVRIERPIALIRIVHRLAQRAQLFLHHCLRHRERLTPLRIDVLMDQGERRAWSSSFTGYPPFVVGLELPPCRSYSRARSY
jgi:hypothetical protein